MEWFTSDEHFGHENVIRFCKRPFVDAREMREELISRHNAVVKPGDIVRHLGDMFWKSCKEEEALEIMDRLNGNHYYVKGNHEETLLGSKKLQSRFVWIRDIARTNSTETTPRIVLCHYAMLVWEGSHRGDWQLYGHSHGELSRGIPDAGTISRLNSFDVGVDCHDYRPISLDEVAKKIKDKQIAAGLSWHQCPNCQHEFFNYSKLDEICVKCLATMRLKALEEDIKEYESSSS